MSRSDEVLKRSERIRVGLAVLLFIFPSALVTLTRAEFWPFSTYDMYSRPLFEKTRPAYVVQVTTTSGTTRVMGMDSLFPIGPHCLFNCIQSLNHENRVRLAKYIFDRCQTNPEVCYLSTSDILSVTLLNTKLYTPKLGRTEEVVGEPIAAFGASSK